jgi:glycosyltransferase involved in cell wall biosynthesis
MDTKNIKIVFIHQDGLITGSAISLRNMITELTTLEYNVSVVTPKAGPAVNMWEQVGAEVLVFPFTTFWTSPGPKCFSRGGLKQLRALFVNHKLKKFLLSLKPDLVHINDKAALQAGVSLKNTGIPILQHSRSAFHLTACKMNAWLSAATIKKYTKHVICISEDEVQGFENYNNKTILYNTVNFEDAVHARTAGLALRESLNIKTTDVVIGMAESFSIHKGLMEITKIAHHVIKNNPAQTIKFLLVGNVSNTDGLNVGDEKYSSKQFLEKFIRDNQLEGRFILTGYQNAPLNYIAAMDLLVVAKAHGVLGRQPIEAQAVGTTVVGLNGHSKKSKIVVNGIGGYLLDTIPLLIDKINELVKEPARLKVMEQMGIEYAQENFNPKNYISKLTSIYFQNNN